MFQCEGEKWAPCECQPEKERTHLDRPGRLLKPRGRIKPERKMDLIPDNLIPWYLIFAVRDSQIWIGLIWTGKSSNFYLSDEEVHSRMSNFTHCFSTRHTVPKRKGNYTDQLGLPSDRLGNCSSCVHRCYVKNLALLWQFSLLFLLCKSNLGGM